MKRLTLTLLCAFFMSGFLYAQRFAYVDTDYILDNIPEYANAQKKIDNIAEDWRKEIDKKYKEIDELYKAYQAEQVLMPEEMKIEKQNEIERKEEEVKELQKRKFGYEGELFQQKQELVKPIQDKVYNEIQKLATTKSLDFIFDKASGISMLFANPKFNMSDDILKELGYTPVNTKESDK